MATKLTSSLRKSISAEQKSVDDKSQPVKLAAPKAVAKPKAAPVAPKTPVSVKSQAEAKPSVVASKPVEPVKSIVKETVAPQTQIPPKATAAIVDAMQGIKDKFSGIDADAKGQYLQGLDSISEVVGKITGANQELLNSCLSSLAEVNEDVSSYVKQIMHLQNLPKLQQINSEFAQTLQKRQQELIEKNMKLFGYFGEFKFPFSKK